MKPGNPPLQSARLLDQLRERIRYMHYSLSTEKVYLYWVLFFVRCSASTHNQALSAVLFLYREVLNIELPWLDGKSEVAVYMVEEMLADQRTMLAYDTDA